MSRDYFQFKQFTVWQGKSAFRVGTDGVLLGAIADTAGRRRILDIGTGTGLIALMLAQRCDAEIVAIEPHRDSFLQARGNTHQSPWPNRIKLVNISLQDFNPGDMLFDLIVSNPPWFIDSLRCPDPARSAARHDDTLSGHDLLEGVLRLLSYDGIFQVIMPVTEGRIFIEKALSYGMHCSGITHISPTQSSLPKRMVISLGRQKSDISEHFLAIEKGKRHEYTSEFLELVKDFYLKL